MSNSNKNADKPKSAEELAADFGPETYRKWVRSEVTQSLFVKIITISGFLVLIGSAVVIWAQNTFLEQKVKRIENSVEHEIGLGINRMLIERIEIVEAVEDELKDKLDNHIKTSKDFAKMVGNAIRTHFGPDFISKEMVGQILKRSRDQALSSQPARVREAGLQLYAAFAAGDADAAVADSDADAAVLTEFKETLLTILDDEVSPPSLKAEASSYYRFETLPSPTCSVDVHTCLDMDRRVVSLAAERLRESVGESSISARREYWAYLNLLVAMPASLLEEVKEEIAALRGDKARGLISIWSEQERWDLLRGLAIYVSQLPALQSSQRDLALTAALGLPPDDTLARTTRGKLVDLLWRAHSEEERLSGWSAEFLLVRDSVLEPLQRWSSSEGSRASQPAEEPQLLYPAIINLLRTGSPDHEPGSSTNNDWDQIFNRHLGFGNEVAVDAFLLSAWGERIRRDGAITGHDVRWAADTMLGRVASQGDDWQRAIYANERAREALAAAVAHAEWPIVEKYADRPIVEKFIRSYLDHTVSTGKADRVLRAFVEKDENREGEKYTFMVSVLEDDQQVLGAAQRDRLLSSLLFSGEDSVLYPAGPTGQWHERLAEYTQSLVEGGDFPGLRNALIQEIVRRLRSPQDEWLMLAGIETTGLFAHIDHLADADVASLRAALPWLADAPSRGEVAAIDVVKGAIVDWQLQREAASTKDGQAAEERVKPSASNGGLWVELTGSADLFVTLEPPDEVELIVYDNQRKNVLGRSERPGDMLIWHIELGSPVLVAARPHTSDALSGKVTVTGETFPPLVPRQRDNPIEIARTPMEARFVTRDSQGEAWLRLSMQEGQRITVETRAGPDSPSDLDTVVYLIDKETDETLGWNDDGPWLGLYSRLQHTSWRDREVLVRIVQLGDQPFQPGTEFTVEIDVEKRRPVGATVGASTRDAPHDLEAGAQTFAFAAGDERGEAWLRTSLAANQRLTVETLAGPDSPSDLDTVVILLDADSDQELARNDDGPGLGLYSNLQHTAWRDRAVLVRIVQLGDQPFEPGTEFVVDVDVEQMPEPEVLRELEEPLVFAATEARREALYRVSLAANERLTVVTGARPGSPEGLDTVVYLLDAATGAELARNDDGPGLGLFSRATYTAASSTELFVRIVEFGERPFAPGTRFTVDVDVAPHDQRAAVSR